MATQYYAAPDGDSANSGLSPSAPFKYIEDFINLPPVTGDSLELADGTYIDSTTAITLNANHAAKTLTISAASGATPIITSTDGTRQVYVNAGGAINTMNVTFTGITFKPANGTTRIFEKNIHGTWTVNFVNCTFGSADKKTFIAKCTDNNAATGTLSFSGCTLDASGALSGGGVGTIVEAVGAMGTISLANCTVACGGDYGFRIATTGNLTAISVTGCTITTGAAMLTSSDFVFQIIDSGIYVVATVTFTDNVVTAACFGFQCNGHFTNADVSRNTITINAANGGCIGLQVGADGAMLQSRYGHARVENNTISHTGASTSHCLLFGRGIFNGTCVGNILSGGDACLVVKSEYSYIANNVAYGTDASNPTVYVRSGIGNFFTNNTIYSDTKNCVWVDHQATVSGANASLGNRFVDNIFMQGTASTSALLYDSAPDSTGNLSGNIVSSMFDRNLYAVAAGGAISLFSPVHRSWLATNGTSTNDLAATNVANSVFTSATYTFLSSDVGKKIVVTAGTNFTPGTYTISSVAGGAATVSGNATTGAGASAGSGYLYTASTQSTLAQQQAFWQKWAVRSWLSSGGTFTNDLAGTNVANSVLSSASYAFVNGDVGKIVHVYTGTNVASGGKRLTINSVSAAPTGTATLSGNITNGAGALSAGAGFLFHVTGQSSMGDNSSWPSFSGGYQNDQGSFKVTAINVSSVSALRTITAGALAGSSSSIYVGIGAASSSSRRGTMNIPGLS